MANSPLEGWRSRGRIQAAAIGGMVEIVFPTKTGPTAVRVTTECAFDLAALIMSHAAEAERQKKP